MAAQSYSNISGLLKENYRYVPGLLQEREKRFFGKVKAKNVETAGARTLRMPHKMTSGGDFRTYSPDGGNMGRGSGATYATSDATPIYWNVAVEWNQQVETETANKKLSVENAFESHLADAYDQYAVQMDKNYQTAGDAILAVQSAGSGTTTITFAGSAFGTRLLYPNQIYDVYDTTLATKRSGGPYRVVSIDHEAGTAVISGAVSSNANTDVWVPAGMTGANPIGLYGIPYHHNGATSGTWENLSRATYPQLRTPFVTASAPLALSQMRLLLNKVRIFRSNAMDSGSWRWYMHENLVDAYQAIQTSIMNYDMSRGGGSFDLLVDPKGIGGIGIDVSSNANPTRIELVDYNNWGRAETVDLKLYDVDDMTTFPIYGTDGGLAAAQIFYLFTAFQTFVDDPGRAGYIASLTKQTGYNY